MAVDWGQRRIGLALGMGSNSFPLPPLEVSSVSRAVEYIVALILEKGVTDVVVGAPFTLKGKKGESYLRAEELAETLKAKLESIGERGVKVTLFDERFSSKAAENLYRYPQRAFRTRKKSGDKKRWRRFKDSISAYVILLDYMEHSESSRSTD